jgi:hypothetical protein
LLYLENCIPLFNYSEHGMENLINVVPFRLLASDRLHKCTYSMFNAARFVQSVRQANAADCSTVTCHRQSTTIQTCCSRRPRAAELLPRYSSRPQSRWTMPTLCQSATRSTWIRTRAILHALANFGFSGFVSFKPTVLRV